jgi:hypothetical protein
MIRLFPLVVLAIYLSACSTAAYVQLFGTKAIQPVTNQNGNYVFENDTVKIVYSLWAEYGAMDFTIYNKLNVPLYIDWRKSAYIANEQKHDYWEDKETVNSESHSVGVGVAYYNVAAAKSATYGQAVKTKPERITFIAPKSQVTKSQYEIYPVAYVKLSKGEISFKANSYSADTNKKVAIIHSNYQLDETPLSFRNFLTFSTSENFTHEFYADNAFYISWVSIMSLQQFLGLSGVTDFDYPFADYKRFFISLDNPGDAYCDGLFRDKRKSLAHNIFTGEWLQKK